MVRNIHVYGKRTKTFLSNINCTELNGEYVQTTAGTLTTLRAVITITIEKDYECIGKEHCNDKFF